MSNPRPTKGRFFGFPFPANDSVLSAGVRKVLEKSSDDFKGCQAGIPGGNADNVIDGSDPARLFLRELLEFARYG